MTLKMDSRDDRIGRSVSLGEMLGHPGRRQMRASVVGFVKNGAMTALT